MPMTLDTFKQEISSTVLQRGRQYFDSGQVIDLEEVGDGAWSASVSGTEVYAVEIQRDPNGLLESTCTCPYDWGPVCKHVAAVLYAIEEGFSEYLEKKPRKPRKKRKTRHEQVLEVLDQLSREDLVELLAQLVQEDRRIANLILARFSAEGGDKKAYVRLVKDAVKAEADRYGFLDYSSSRRAAHSIFNILQRADDDLRQGRDSQAVPIFQAVVETVVPAIQHADDSSGELGDCIRIGLDGLQEAAQKLPPDEQREFFDYCLSQAPSKPYEGWDWGWDLAHIAAGMVTAEAERQRLYDVLDTMASRRKDTDDWLSRFDHERAEAIKLLVIERLDDVDTCLAYLTEHIDMEQFRERLVRHHIEQGHLDEARRLCKEWLDEPQPRHRGYYSNFLDLLLKIAQMESNPDEVARLAEELFFDTGSFQYYEVLKKTVEAPIWPEFLKQLIEKARNRSRQASLVPEIYVKEELWRQLLNAIEQAHRYTVEHYREHLEPRFPAEVGLIYERIVGEILKEKANRKGYQEACRYLRRMQKMGQTDRVRTLVDALREQYKNRPALLDELDKV